MAEKLIDPSFDKFHLFDEKDGVILRNDGREFQPAEKNPWYVLATLFGEPYGVENNDPIDSEFSRKNRKAWNSWAFQGMSPEQRLEISKKLGISGAEFDNSPAYKTEITRRFRARMGVHARLPSPRAEIDFKHTLFHKPLKMDRYYIPSEIDFQ